MVFQPHLYSRTEAFAREFGQALDGADEVFVLDVYAAREQPMAGVSGAIVAEHVSVPVHYVPDFSAVADQVADAARPGDVVVTMGAGDVTMLGPEILAALGVRPTAAHRRADPERARDDASRRTAPRSGRRAGRRTRTPHHRSEEEAAPAKRTSRARDGGPGANAKSAAPPRPAPSRSRKPAARPSAARRVSAADDSETLGRGMVRGLKVLMWTVAAHRRVVGLGLLLYFTPIMSARNVVITGLGAVTQDEVIAAAGVTPGTPLLQIDTDEVADRVATIRRVATARVQREYPSTLRITVVERVPVVVKDYPDGPHLFDRDGVDFATAPPPPGLPYLDVDNPGPSDPPTKAALQVLTALRPEVAGQVGRIAAPSVASITLTLADGREVMWGTTDRTEEKAQKLAALLTQPGHTYDVSSPDLPTVK